MLALCVSEETGSRKIRKSQSEQTTCSRNLGAHESFSNGVYISLDFDEFSKSFQYVHYTTSHFFKGWNLAMILPFTLHSSVYLSPFLELKQT